MSAFNEGLPLECKLSDLDITVPEGTISRNVRIQPSNLSSIVSPTTTYPAATVNLADSPFNAQTIVFDLPAGQNGQWLDTRQSSLTFRAVYEVVTAGSACGVASAQLRSSAAAFFDRMEVLGPAGNILESVAESGVVFDTLAQIQMSNSERDGVGLMYGFDATTTIYSDGHQLGALIGSGTALTAGNTQTNSYALPILSASLGSAASRFFPIGAVPRMQLQFTTSNILPVSIVGGATVTTAGTFKITLTDFVLNLQYISLPQRAQAMLEQSLHDGKYYLQGNSYRCTTGSLAASSTGFASVLTGLRASSLKSFFTRFVELNSANNKNGKYNSKNPLASTLAANFNGQRYPAIADEVLLHPARGMLNLQRAIGSFNNTEMTSSITPVKYCVLSTGGTASGVTTTTQDAYWNLTDEGTIQASFIWGVNVEDIAKRGVMSGLNINSASGYVELNIASPGPTYAHTVYCIGMCDSIFVIDARSGDVQVRI